MREPFTLQGTFVRLEPLTEAHIPALVEAAGLDRSDLPVDLHARRARSR